MMNSDTSSGRSRWRRPPQRILAVTAGLVLLTAACTGSPSSTGSGGPAQSTGPSNYQKALAYSQCMRSNGVPDFPDPIVNANGTITFSRPGTTSGSQSRSRAAGDTCQHLLPSGSQLSQAHQQQQLTSELKFAQCMRSHGVPNWPDPTLMGTEYEFNLNAENISPFDPRIEAAERTCQSQLQLSPQQVHLPV